jgi:hypothetical protein
MIPFGFRTKHHLSGLGGMMIHDGYVMLGFHGWCHHLIWWPLFCAVSILLVSRDILRYRSLCKHICVTNWGWFPRKRSVDYRLSPGKPGPSYPMMFGWIFFGLYRQMAANVPKNLLARHLYVTNQGTTEHGYLRMLRSTGLYSSILRTMMPLLHLLSRRPCMTPLQPVPLL